MFKKVVAGFGLGALLATVALAQDVAQPGAAQPDAARGAGRGAGRGAAADPNTPTEAQWNTPEAQAYVAKAKEFAGSDPDLQFDDAYNCTASGTHVGGSGNGAAT